MDTFRAVETYDTGYTGCGDLVLLLRIKLRSMPGELVRIVARDPAAPEDIPAWCRLTRNELVRHEPHTHSFWIRSRTDWT
ncbi:sulfurtransferase TusA family protein [Xanthobacter sp. VNH20]|uniref:sulfurtransferase TusA family protein n=1 Tax=Xanthobacter sp. VNH20 TaxID=3156616 RepID=UPI0032B55E0B